MAGTRSPLGPHSIPSRSALDAREMPVALRSPNTNPHLSQHGVDPRQCSTECWCAGSAESTAKGIPSPSAPFPLPFNVLHHRPPISLPALDPACLFHALVDPYWMPLVHLIGRPLVHRLVSRFVLGAPFPSLRSSCSPLRSPCSLKTNPHLSSNMDAGTRSLVCLNSSLNLGPSRKKAQLDADTGLPWCDEWGTRKGLPLRDKRDNPRKGLPWGDERGVTAQAA